MKRIYAIALIALTTLAGVGGAMAQEAGVRATVPFEFTVGGRLLSADTYTITSPRPGLVLIQSADKHSWVMTSVSHGNNESAQGSQLVFAKYGDRYFLHEILCPTVAEMNLRIPASKLEKRVKVQEARFGGEAVPVLVAAR